MKLVIADQQVFDHPSRVDGLNKRRQSQVSFAPPGAIMTNLARHMDAKTLESLRALPFVWKTPEQGAATTVLLAASPRLAGIGGRLLRGLQRGRGGVRR